MKKQNPGSSTIRLRAEKRLKSRATNISSMQKAEIRELVHELEVHQIELEIQNEELRQAQVELAQARDRYLDLYDFAPVGYLTVDNLRVIREANLTAAGMLGVERRSLLGARLERYLSEVCRDDCYLCFRHAASSGRREVFEGDFLGPTGSTFFGRLEIVPEKAEAPESSTFSVVLTDVTERRRAEQEREKSEQELRDNREDLNRAQAVAHTGSWRMNIQRNELTWSDESYRIYGIPKGKLLTYESSLAVVHPEDRESVDRTWKAALRGEPFDIEHRLVVEGTVKWVHQRAELEFDEKGDLLGGFGTCQDITDRKLLSMKLEELNKTLEQRVTKSVRERERDLTAHQRSLENKNVALREVIAQIQVEKNQIRADIAANVHEMVFPVLERLSVTAENERYLTLLRKVLHDLASPFGRRFAEASAALTAKEKEICRMIKGGLSSKEIAGMLAISPQTVEKHRKNIRRKLGITSTGANLGSFLDTF